MSIEYFVEGKAITQTGGDYKTYAKEGIDHNSAVSVEQKGNDTGVSYNAAQKINPNDKPVDTIDVSLNLFFDGTQNNKTNTQLGGDYEEASSDKDDSYNNDFTNVARGYDAIDPNAQNQVSWYIEGIGTEDKKGDSILKGVAQGEGATGVVAKVAKGCKKGAEALALKFKGQQKKINLTVNVFGFSRGAAAARHFVHVASTMPMISYARGKQILQVFPPDNIDNGRLIINDKDGSKLQFISQFGYFGACLVEKELEIKQIKFKFAGLYDTVASYGINHRGGWGLPNDTEELGLDTIGRGKVQFVLQLASDDEYRDNFDLTNINSTGLHGLEFTLPGVHSDIGGSYGEGDTETSVLYCDPYDEYNNVNTHQECLEFKKIVIDEGWYTDKQLEIKYFRQKDVNYGRMWNFASQYYGLIGTRKLSNKYDQIPLNQMFHYSKLHDVKYIENRIDENHKIKDSFLTGIYSQLLTYMNACNNVRNKYVGEYNEGKKPSVSKYIQEIKALSYLGKIDSDDLKTLRNQYLHWSVKANQIGLDAKPNDNAPKRKGALAAQYRKRNIQNG
ncbi:T6SS phospholipase effector Tle1-like catalytic domain-containing protein [Chryseobacterium sp. MMS23-Vi53]|uniref:T6SS phospholipase effector Tle1-like catalytic domain-containing protein n=1 Tax=Chryseobacterium sp. MMS23-Vi53 TaxID=3386644 RepID=UPI0039EAC27D